MMDKFTASNGVTVWRDSTTGNLRFGGDAVDLDHLREKLSGESRGMYPAMDAALREFFQAERDEELGRWRWPKNPDYVVYPREDGGGHVLNERTADVTYRNGLGVHDMEGAVAKEYRDAHPERKPWHDAKPGEVWAISTANVADEVAVRACISNEVLSFEYVTSVITRLDVTDARIVTGRRIWPEAS